MDIENLKFKIIEHVGYNFLNIVCKTLKVKVIGEEMINGCRDKTRGVIIVAWHGRMYLPMYYLRKRGFWGIVSPSRDGEYFARVFSRFGWNIIRGSSRKGSVSALLAGIRVLKKGNVLAVTPDGPIGPKGKVDTGLIYLAASAGANIIPVGVGFKNKISLPTWDEAIIPCPFSKCVILFDELMQVPENVYIKDIPDYAKKLEDMMKAANKKADEIAREQK